jgi:hypothetical protein
MAKVNIGLRQAKLLCQLPEQKRLDLIGEGLPIILESARGFWHAAEQLADNNPREADVLEGFVKEEAAKILILMDVVRCPSKLVVKIIGSIVTNFYDHLARLLYATAQGWRPTHVTQLQEYLDSERKSYYLEGYIGEYIVPNSAISTRERQLYADIQASEDGTLTWSEPKNYTPGIPHSKPIALAVAEALSANGILTRKGLDVTAEVWGRLEFKNNETRADAERLTEELLTQLNSKGLSSAAVASNDLNALRWSWQMPMYHLNFKMDHVPREDLVSERDAKVGAEMGWQ